MLKILTRCGAPPKLCLAIERVYTDLKVVLKIRKIEESISQTIGVRQGDYMVPILFLIMVMVFTETIELEWIKEGLTMISLRQQMNSPRYTVQLTGHKSKTFTKRYLIHIFCILYVDDGAFTFKNRSQLVRGLELIYLHFNKFGLEINTGRGNTASKTKCVFPLLLVYLAGAASTPV